MQTQHSISIQIKSFEGLEELVFIITFIDKIHYEDHHSILDWCFFYLFEFFYVHEDIGDYIVLNMFFLSLSDMLLQPFVLHNFNHWGSFIDISVYHFLD